MILGSTILTSQANVGVQLIDIAQDVEDRVRFRSAFPLSKRSSASTPFTIRPETFRSHCTKWTFLPRVNSRQAAGQRCGQARQDTNLDRPTLYIFGRASAPRPTPT